MINLNGQSLTLTHIYKIATQHENVALDPKCLERLESVRIKIEQKAKSSSAYYGINTGFGALAETKISPEDISTLQHNLVLSHAVGTGSPLNKSEARALMLLRLNTLLKGHSGIRPLVLDNLAKLLNSEAYPYVPRKGSVGASGDLAPLSHLALLLIGEGQAYYQNKLQPAKQVLEQVGLKPLTLHAKEGLALINGTQAMSAVGSLALYEALSLCDWADKIGAASVDALMGSCKPFDPRIHEIRPHPGQIHSAKYIAGLLEGSELRDSHRDCERVQDAYSLRCMPQVHGATRDSLEHCKQVLEREINSATDNPLLFETDDLDIISGGNFHGQPVALALDFMAIAVSELANISERRVEQMLNPALSSGLPAFLTPDPGLNSGFMMLQVTAGALINENKVLCHPASVDTISASASREDHVSMGMTAANKLQTVIENVRTCLAIELMCTCQALDLRAPLKSSNAIQDLHQNFRKHVAFAKEDRFFGEDLEKSKQALSS